MHNIRPYIVLISSPQKLAPASSQRRTHQFALWPMAWLCTKIPVRCTIYWTAWWSQSFIWWDM